MHHVAVIGGGIAGLTAAFELRERGYEVTLFEADGRLGGKIYTDHVDELVIDAGPDSFLSTKPAALQIIDRLGLHDRVINTLPDGGGTYILRDGKLQPLPEGITLLVPADVRSILCTPLLTPAGKVRMVLEYVIPARREESDESIGDFVRRRVGREAFERMAEPLLSGIYAGDADRLSLLSTFPRLREVEREHGGVIRGAIAQRKQARSASAGRDRPKRSPFVSLAGGLSELIDALERTIGEPRIKTNCRVAGLREHEAGIAVALEGGWVHDFDAVVVAIPAHQAANILAAYDADLAAVLGGITYVSSATVSLAFDQSDIAGKQLGRGFVIPRAEGRALTAVTWTSNKFGGRVPDGVALLRGFVGRAGNETPAFLSDPELIALVRRELGDILGIDAQPILARVYRWLEALPQYNLGHQERLDMISDRLECHPRVALTGAAYRGVGIPDCIRDATDQVSLLVDRLEVTSSAAVKT